MSLFNEENLKTIQQAEKALIKRTILIIDDEEHNLVTLKDALIDQYDVLTACDGLEALELLTNDTDPSRIHLIISDQRMPNMTGVEFLAKSIEIVPQTVRIILTAYTDVEAIMDSINYARIFKFILKPFDVHDIKLTLKRALEAFDLEKRNKQLVEALKFLNENLFTHLRDNLQQMMGASELLSLAMEKKLPNNLLDLFSQLQKSGKSMVDLLERSSELSFIYTGHKQPRMEQLDIIDLIQHEVTKFKKNTAQTPSSITFKGLLVPSTDLQQNFYLEIDRELFCKSLHEILHNSLVYCDGKAEITLSAYIENNLFCLSIGDRGIGIESGGGMELMHPFIRGQESFKYQSFGLGMGLAKAKSFLEIQSAELTLLPEKEGTTLLITLPLSRGDFSDSMLEENPHRVIIYQEDEEDLLLYTKLLEFENHEVRATTDADQIIKLIGTWRPQTAILDSHFKKQSTIKLIQQIGALEIPITTLILTNDSSPRIDHEYLDAGAGGIVVKPVNYGSLKKLLYH